MDSADSTPGQSPWLSIIIPARNEASFIGPTLERAFMAKRAEVIVVDGQSEDNTAEVAESYGAVVLRTPPGRACQMNHGAAHAVGEVLLFLPADTLLPLRFDQYVHETIHQADVIAGAFCLRIDAPNRSLRLIERFANLRSRILQMPYGDQAVFLKTTTFCQLGGYSALPVMEDYELARRLRRIGRIRISRAAVMTSGRRWLTHGIWRTTLTHQIMIVAYHLRVSPDRIATWREPSHSEVAAATRQRRCRWSVPTTLQER